MTGRMTLTGLEGKLRCVAYNCRSIQNSSKQIIGVNGEKKTKRSRFYQFPKDRSNVAKWMSNMGVKYSDEFEEELKFTNTFDPKGLGVSVYGLCDEHFSGDCYERDLQAELCGMKRRYILRDDAVPTIFPHRYDVTTADQELAEKRVSPSKMTKRQLVQLVSCNIKKKCDMSRPPAKRNTRAPPTGGGGNVTERVPTKSKTPQQRTTPPLYSNTAESADPFCNYMYYQPETPPGYRMKNEAGATQGTWVNLSEGGDMKPMLTNHMINEEPRPANFENVRIKIEPIDNQMSPDPQGIVVKSEPGSLPEAGTMSAPPTPVPFMSLVEPTLVPTPPGPDIPVMQPTSESDPALQEPVSISQDSTLVPGVQPTLNPANLNASSAVYYCAPSNLKNSILTRLPNGLFQAVSLAVPTALGGNVTLGNNVTNLCKVTGATVAEILNQQRQQQGLATGVVPDDNIRGPAGKVATVAEILHKQSKTRDQVLMATDTVPSNLDPAAINSVQNQPRLNVKKGQPNQRSILDKVSVSLGDGGEYELLSVPEAQSSVVVSNQSVSCVEQAGRNLPVSEEMSPFVSASPIDSNERLNTVDTAGSNASSGLSTAFSGHRFTIHSSNGKLDQATIQKIVKAVLYNNNQAAASRGKVGKPYRRVIHLDAAKSERYQDGFSRTSMSGGNMREVMKTGVRTHDKTVPRQQDSDKGSARTTTVYMKENDDVPRFSQIRNEPRKRKQILKPTVDWWDAATSVGSANSDSESDDLLPTYVRTPLEKFLERIPQVTPPEVQECHPVNSDENCTVFKCDMCLKYFPCRNLMLAHKITHIDHFPEPQFKKLTTDELQFKNVKTDEGNFENHCRFCERVFMFRDILEKHEYLVHGENPATPSRSKRTKCRMCGSEFTDFMRHARSAHKDLVQIRNECPLCQRDFKSVACLNRHMRKENIAAHRVLARNPCPQPQCDKKFVYRANMVSHFKSHFEFRPPFFCPKCNFPSNSKGALLNHILTCTSVPLH